MEGKGDRQERMSKEQLYGGKNYINIKLISKSQVITVKERAETAGHRVNQENHAW